MPTDDKTFLQKPSADLFPDEATPVSLVDGLKAGNDDAWARFVKIFGPMVFGMLRNRGLSENDASEIGHEVFIKVHRSIDSFARDGKDRRLRYWLPSVIRSVFLDAARKKNTVINAVGGSEFQGIAQQIPDATPDLYSRLGDDDFDITESDFDVAFREGCEVLKDRFSEKAWRCFYEAHANQRTRKEIAEELDMAENTVRQAIHRVKAAFEKQFEGLLG